MIEFEGNRYPTDKTAERIRTESVDQRAVQAHIHFDPALANRIQTDSKKICFACYR